MKGYNDRLSDNRILFSMLILILINCVITLLYNVVFKQQNSKIYYCN